MLKRLAYGSRQRANSCVGFAQRLYLSHCVCQRKRGSSLCSQVGKSLIGLETHQLRFSPSTVRCSYTFGNFRSSRAQFILLFQTNVLLSVFLCFQEFDFLVHLS